MIPPSLRKGPLFMLSPSIWIPFLVCLILGADPRTALANPTTQQPLSGLEQAISDQMTGLIQKNIDENFRLLKIPPPAAITVKTKATLTQDGTSPRLAEVQFNVTMVTDQPPQIVKSIRQKLLRMLKDQGYRLDEAAPGTDLKPLAILSIESRPSVTPGQEERSPWIYAGFAFVLLALCTSLGVLTYALIWPLLGWRRRRRSRKLTPPPSPPEPTLPDLDLPNLQRMEAAPIQAPHSLEFNAPDSLPHLAQLPQLPPRPLKAKSEIDLGPWSTLSSADHP